MQNGKIKMQNDRSKLKISNVQFINLCVKLGLLLPEAIP
jgi:hypothetical protein